MQAGRTSGYDHHPLTGITRCGICGTLMMEVGPDFICPNALHHRLSHFHENSINVVTLHTKVTDHLIGLVLNERTPLPHLRRETPRVQQAHQGQTAGHSLGHSSLPEYFCK